VIKKVRANGKYFHRKSISLGNLKTNAKANYKKFCKQVTTNINLKCIKISRDKLRILKHFRNSDIMIYTY